MKEYEISGRNEHAGAGLVASLAVGGCLMCVGALDIVGRTIPEGTTESSQPPLPVEIHLPGGQSIPTDPTFIAVGLVLTSVGGLGLWFRGESF